MNNANRPELDAPKGEGAFSDMSKSHHFFQRIASGCVFVCFVLGCAGVTPHSNLPSTGEQGATMPRAASALAPIRPPQQPIVLDSPALYPETVVYDEGHDRFLVGSIRTGGIYSVGRNGAVERIINDERLCSVLGIAVDVTRNRIVAVSSDLGVSTNPSVAGPQKLAVVATYDLVSGKALYYVDLAPLAPASPHLLNGLAVDAEGNAYISDSFSPALYKVDAAGHASVFISDERFAGQGINLNGLVVHPDGYLLVVKKSDGQLFKVPLSDPRSLSVVAVEKSFPGGDGLLLTSQGELVLVANEAPGVRSNAAYLLISSDSWATATVRQEIPLGDVYPTTAVSYAGQVHVLHSKLNELLQSPAEKRADSLRLATLQPIGTLGTNVEFFASKLGESGSNSEAHAMGLVREASPKAFVYAELQLAIPFERAPWLELNAELAQQPGLLNTTWLAGVDDSSLAGLYAFDSIEHAQAFVTSYFPARARKFGVAQTTRIFDATVTEEASRGMDSVHFGAALGKAPGAFVYTEVQVNAPFSYVPWRERNPAIRKNRGFLAKTWLSGLDTHTVGGLYAFDTIENAKAFALTFFADSAAKQGKAFTTRVFDARVAEHASHAANSPFYP